MNNVTSMEFMGMRSTVLMPLVIFIVFFGLMLATRYYKKKFAGRSSSFAAIVFMPFMVIPVLFGMLIVVKTSSVVRVNTAQPVAAVPMTRVDARQASVDAWRSAMSLSQDVGQYACRELAFEGVAANVVTDMRAGISRGSQHKLSLDFTIRSYDLAVDREKDAMMAALRRRILKAFPEMP